MSKLILESTGLALEADSRVDVEAGVISGVRVLGGKSSNRRTYPDPVLEAAFRIYEGAQVYADHDYSQVKTGKARPLGQWGGVLRGPRYSPGSVFADLHCLKETSAGRIILEAAARFPDKFGLSPMHLIESKKERDGSETVTAILECWSVDAVTRPATTRTLFEQDESTMPENGGATAAPPAMSLEEWLGMGAAIIMASPDYDDTEKLAATKELFKFKAKILGNGEEEAPAEDGAEAPPEGESANRPVLFGRGKFVTEMRAEMRYLKIALLAGEEFNRDPKVMQTLLSLKTDEEVADYLGTLRRARRPRFSSGPVRSSGRVTVAESGQRRPEPVPKLTAGADRETVKRFYRGG